MFRFDCDRVVNNMGKGDNVGNQYFSPFCTVFSKGFLLRLVKNKDFLVEGQEDAGLNTLLSHLFWDGQSKHCRTMCLLAATMKSNLPNFEF